MSPPHVPLNVDVQSFPRVSGDEPRFLLTLIDELPFSPRERG